jgi:hypothetical protein
LPEVRKTAAYLASGVVLTLAGCARSDTGIHIHARLGSLAYDELQFGVTGAGSELVVDPATAGRYQGPFAPGDQDVLVYLRDDLAGSQLHCEASALRAAAVVGTGASDVSVVRGEMTDVDIVMMAAPGGGPGKPDDGGAGKPDDGGSGMPGGGGPGMPGGGACVLGAECAPVGCADDGKSIVPAGSCDGAGKCVIPEKIKCAKEAACVAGVCVDAESVQP